MSVIKRGPLLSNENIKCIVKATQEKFSHCEIQERIGEKNNAMKISQTFHNQKMKTHVSSAFKREVKVLFQSLFRIFVGQCSILEVSNSKS